MAKRRSHWRQVRWRSASSTASERAGRAPTGQRAESVAQQQGLARSVGARDGHEGPGRHIRALTPRLSPPRTLPERPRRRPAPRLWTLPLLWTQRTRPQELGKPRRRGFPQAPTASIVVVGTLNQKNPTTDQNDRQVSRFGQFYVTVDREGRRAFGPGFRGGTAAGRGALAGQRSKIWSTIVVCKSIRRRRRRQCAQSWFGP